MKKIICLLLILSCIFFMASCDLSDTIDQYSNLLYSNIIEKGEPFLKEDSSYKAEGEENNNEGSTLVSDPLA